MKNNYKLILMFIFTISILSLPYIVCCETLSIAGDVFDDKSRPLSIAGEVFNDENCNGNLNGHDNGIAGVTITLNPGTITTTTAADGTYSFTELDAGTYTIKEEDPSGYCSTTPNKITVTLAKKKVTNIDFGDSKNTISPPDICCPH